VERARFTAAAARVCHFLSGRFPHWAFSLSTH